MRLRANAKINLFLEVLGKRDTGFHDIATVFQSVSLADELDFEAADDIRLTLVDGDAGGVPLGPDNIVTRAADLLRERAGGSPGARITVRKRIPVGAGLGGGSADAAATLVGLNRLWDAGFDASLGDLALELGSDVPFCLIGGAAIGRGRGERLEPISLPPQWFVLGISDEPLSTALVYARWRRGGADPMPMPDQLTDPEALPHAVYNALEAPALALRPEIAAAKRAMVDAGAPAAFMTGSGPTIVGLAASEEDAHRIADAVKGAFDRVEVAASRPRGVEPSA